MALFVKALVALVLLAGLLLAALSPPPRRPAPPRPLLALIAAALALDAAGALAALLHRPGLAVAAIAGGVAGCGLAAWLSRADGGDDGDDDPEPVPSPSLGDWARFDAARRDWERRGAPPAVRR